ncbi:MAG: ATP-binding protein, partial [Solirubrobacterales bacterium]
ELEVQSVELELASRHKSEFLASMSHVLRTPLNAVLGFSEVLLERMFGDINERQEEYLRDIHGSGQHLLELLNEILDLSKVEAGRMDLEYSSFDLRSLMELAASMLRERAVLHGIDLTIETADDVGSVYVDELRLKQVLLNLITNAVKFTGDGGSVVVRALREGTEILITVTDTGIGVPEADRERIFESFQQGGRGSSREEGTGLGLTLSRRIVELLGGRMWLETEVGRGSTFVFSLPAGDRSAVGPPANGVSTPASGEVVVIEDDRPSLDLFSAYLSGEALKVTTARDGQSGLAAVRRTLPDAVLLDIRLPGIDGWAVLKELKAATETRDIPVIVVSIVDERARGAAMGAAAYLVKPVGREELLSALTTVGAPVQGPEAEHKHQVGS